MAEWFKRSTVNTFYRGSIPLKALKKNLAIKKKMKFFLITAKAKKKNRTS